VIYVVGNSNKPKKTRFWKEKSIEDVVTLGPTAQATLVTMNNWILTLLDPTNINMPRVLYEKKIPRDENILQKYKIEIK
jgi:hypothetical protein